MFNYIYLIVPFVCAISAQVIKFIVESLRFKKLDWARLFNGNGGMPSSHTSFTFSLCFTVLFLHGADSIYFAICLISSCIIAYDSMGLRMESGKQAVMINLILDEISKKNARNAFKKLKEQLGHKPLEVVMGILWAFICALILTSLLG